MCILQFKNVECQSVLQKNKWLHGASTFCYPNSYVVAGSRSSSTNSIVVAIVHQAVLIAGCHMKSNKTMLKPFFCFRSTVFEYVVVLANVGKLGSKDIILCIYVRGFNRYLWQTLTNLEIKRLYRPVLKNLKSKFCMNLFQLFSPGWQIGTVG